MPQTSAPIAAQNIALYPWFKFFRSLTFWQAIWFLFFQDMLSAADAILLYAIYDIGTIVLEVPSGYMSDRLGRRVTLILSAFAGLGGAVFLAMGESFQAFAMAQVCLGASTAFASGTDSALLYESLAATGREGEIEAQELKAWRVSFIALALSAVLGGAGYGLGQLLPFYAGIAAFACALAVTFGFKSLPRRPVASPEGAEILRLASLKTALRMPVLNWLFGLSVLMYVFSHIPYVFGQPFILQALSNTGFQGDAPLVSGFVTAIMMLVSVAVSLYARALRHLLGLSAILLLAFALQIALSAALSLSGQAIAIAILFLRMIPDALSKPFILARIQPLLNDETRATYISLQSFCGRLIFAGALLLTSRFASSSGPMPAAEIQQILGWYALAGLACLIVLALIATRLKIDNKRPNRAL
jgi:MFS family permease